MLLALALCSSCDWGRNAGSKSPSAVTSAVGGEHNRVGFFTPRGIPPGLVGKVQFGMIAGYSPQQVEESLNLVEGSVTKVNIDVGPTVARVVRPGEVRMEYVRPDGRSAVKAFRPLAVTKLRALPDDRQLKETLAPFIDAMKKHPANVGTIFLADEPYLNGISKRELERAGRAVRAQLNEAGLAHVKLGVIFASAMFHREFARFMEMQAGRYVEGIDTVYRRDEGLLDSADSSQRAMDFRSWVSVIKSGRLSTYDTAGNMYSGGGVPDGFEVFGFDFYLSTILLDGVHEHTLEWFAENTAVPSCAQFKDKPVSKIRSELSFFGGAPNLNEGPRSDERILDAMYNCRMGATTEMLDAAVSKSHAELLMISESSSNGVLSFGPDAKPMAQQATNAVEARALDEVVRAERFYTPQRFRAGLMFFTYQDEYDDSIDLKIAGAQGMPRVSRRILDLAR